MKTQNRKIKQYSKPCPECNKEIKGFSESQVDFNLKLHLEAHKRNKSK